MSRTRLAPGTQRLAGWGLRGIRARTSWPGSTRLSLQCWNLRHEDQSFCPFEKTKWRLCLSRTCLLCFFCSLPRKLFSALVSMLNDAPKGGPRELSGSSPLSLPHPAAPPRASPASSNTPCHQTHKTVIECPIWLCTQKEILSVSRVSHSKTEFLL